MEKAPVSRRRFLVVLALPIALTLGACYADKPQYDIKATSPRDGYDLCLFVNNIEESGMGYSKRDPAEGEVDYSGLYCRVEARVGDPNGWYPDRLGTKS